MRQKRGRQVRQFNISQLGAAAQEQIRRTIGDAQFNKLTRKEGRQGARIKVCPKEERTIDGIVFASGWEAKVYVALRDRLGRERFTLQPRFVVQEGTLFEGKKVRPIVYVADFLIGPPRNPDGPLLPEHIVVDAKGHITEAYGLKRKLFLGRYKRAVVEIKSKADFPKLWESVSALASGPSSSVPAKPA